MEDEFNETSKALTQAQEELRTTQQELQSTLAKLREKENELQQGTVKMRKVYKALERAQQEVHDMRYTWLTLILFVLYVQYFDVRLPSTTL